MTENVIVAVFPSRAMLTRALDHLMELKTIEIIHAAIVAKVESGAVVVLDDDIGADEGGIAGGVGGAALTAFGVAQLGALAIPGVGAILVIGAAALSGGLIGSVIGRVVAHRVNLGAARYAFGRVELMAETLVEGHPALMLQVRDAQRVFETLKTELSRFRVEGVERLQSAPA